MYIERILLDQISPKPNQSLQILPLLLTGRNSVCDVELESSQHLSLPLTAKGNSQTDCTAPTYCWCETGKRKDDRM